MLVLTPSERRGAWLLVLLFALGSGHDLWRAHVRDRRRAEVAPAPVGTLAPNVRPDPWDSTPRGPSLVRDPQDSAPPQPFGTADSASSTVGIPPATGAAKRIDINRANAQELDALPGIGPVLAGRIVEHRRRHGCFQRAEDLLSIRGIGARLLQRIRPHVVVETVTSCIGQDSTHP